MTPLYIKSFATALTITFFLQVLAVFATPDTYFWVKVSKWLFILTVSLLVAFALFALWVEVL